MREILCFQRCGCILTDTNSTFYIYFPAVIPPQNVFPNTTNQEGQPLEKEKRRTEPVVGASDGSLKSELFFEGTSDLRDFSENVPALISAHHHP